MSKLLEYAENELRLAGMAPDPNSDNPNLVGAEAAMGKCIMDLLKVFQAQGHSGFSAAYCLAVFDRLVRQTPWAPLTGQDDEWNDVRHYSNADPAYQNKRCPHVFKRADGTCYYTTNTDRGRVEIKSFPFTPPGGFDESNAGPQ